MSHKFLDEALGKAKASNKTRALFRVIYAAAQGAARIIGPDGKFTLSQIFDIVRGVIQGDIISPIFFVIALDELVQANDKTHGTGIGVGHIKDIRVLGYADDAAMAEWQVEDMTKRLTEFADAAIERADMKVKLQKTYSQIVCRQKEVGDISQKALDKKMASYKYACTFAEAGCTQRFKTRRGMNIHVANCSYNYGRTDEAYPVEEILEVFGHAARRLFLIKWEGYPGEDSWVTEHSLLQDGLAENIKAFWQETGKNPACDYYADPEGEVGTRCWMCGWKSSKRNKLRGLKMHIRKKGHEWKKARAQLTERADVKRDLLEKMQEQLPSVKWGDLDVKNCWRFEYLGSLFLPNADQMPDVQRRCAMAKQRAGTLRHIWASSLKLDLKVRLYIAACCSILVYGSEAWLLDESASRCINGANAYMLSHITGKSKREEAMVATTTFNILAWIRARRLKWVGHILRLKKRRGEERLIKKTLKVIYDHRQDGDIFMDVPEEPIWE